jgi:hypothetical protein
MRYTLEDLLDGDGIVEVGHELELPPAVATRERVGMKDLRDEARPTRGTAALLGGRDVKSRFSDAEPIMRRREVIGYRRGDGEVKIAIDTGSGDVTVEPLS